METETERWRRRRATVERRLRGKVGASRGSLPGVEVRLETVFQLTVATQSLSEDRGNKGGGEREVAPSGWEEGKRGWKGWKLRLISLWQSQIWLMRVSKKRKEQEQERMEGGGSKGGSGTEELEERRWLEGYSEAEWWRSQWLMGHFSSFHPAVRRILSNVLKRRKNSKFDFDVFPSAGVRPFNRPAEKNTHTIRLNGKSLSRVHGSWESSYCSLLCRWVLTIFFMFSSAEN